MKRQLIGKILASIGLATTLASQATAQEAASTSRRGVLNPDISVNALMLYTNSNRGNDYRSEEVNGFSIQEAELQFTADVDPYTKLNAIFSAHQEERDLSAATPERTSGWAFEAEELYVDTLSIPSLTLRAGKFKTAFGKHNQLHTHAFPFIDAPLIQSELLGHHGMTDVGLSASALLPVGWFSEFTLQAVSGRMEEVDYFNSRSPNDNVFVARFVNLLDLSESITAELGVSDAFGKNEEENAAYAGKTNLYGADLTFKWRPTVGGRSAALSWTTEYINRNIDTSQATEKGGGFASWVQYQFAQRWWAQARGEYLQIKDDVQAQFHRKYTALVGFVPTEFSAARLQYSMLEDGSDKPEHKVYLQLNFTIGAHPAHLY